MRILFAATLTATAVFAGCGEDTSARAIATPEPSTVTVTATTTATATPRPAVTVTSEVTVTATQTVIPAPSGPSEASGDVTATYTSHARSAGMPARQLDDLVRASLTNGQLDVLTTMSPGWGGWDCTWEPRELAGQPVQFSRVLYQDGTVFRVCN